MANNKCAKEPNNEGNEPYTYTLIEKQMEELDKKDKDRDFTKEIKTFREELKQEFPKIQKEVQTTNPYTMRKFLVKWLKF